MSQYKSRRRKKYERGWKQKQLQKSLPGSFPTSPLPIFPQWATSSGSATHPGMLPPSTWVTPQQMSDSLLSANPRLLRIFEGQLYIFSVFSTITVDTCELINIPHLHAGFFTLTLSKTQSNINTLFGAQFGQLFVDSAGITQMVRQGQVNCKDIPWLTECWLMFKSGDVGYVLTEMIL